MTCIIIEDQPPAQRILKKFISDIGTLELKATFSDALKALEFLKSESVDLIFLDIHLPKISGLDFLKVLPNPPHIILTTAFSDYALESYEFSVVDYLLKPFSFQRFVKAVSKISVEKPTATMPVQASEQTSFRQEMFIKSGYEHIKITIADILFIKSDSDYTEITLANKKYLSSETLRHWTKELDENIFIRIHKSYLINSTKVKKMVGNQLYLANNQTVPIGRAYKESFMNRFIH